ncbi:MAG: hypothetical protein KUG77_17125 [Nannocystaceae bacterium]|nr:hypothetical protein [Nannocystaceae bacterium]
MSMRLYVRLDREQLLAQEPHLEHGGMLVPAPAEVPAPMTDVLLRIACDGASAEVEASVVHVGDGQLGLALLDLPRARTRLAPLFAKARGEAVDEGTTGNLRLRITRMSAIEKQDLALTGSRLERLALLKDSNKALHLLVLKNQKITSEEVRMLAGFRNANPQALQKIAANSEWVRDGRIVAALVGNPKTPAQVAVRLIDRLPASELRRLAKATDVPPAISKAARRKLG